MTPTAWMNTAMSNGTISAMKKAEKLGIARHIAADVRARNFPPPCMCETCVSVRNLPAIQRILAAYRVKEES